MSFLTDLRYTFRQIANNPGFFALAVAALALGVGANTAIFSAVEAVLLKPLPYSQPDRLVVVWEDASNVGFAFNTPAPANYLDWQAWNQVFTDMLGTRFDTASLTGDGQPEQLAEAENRAADCGCGIRSWSGNLRWPSLCWCALG